MSEPPLNLHRILLARQHHAQNGMSAALHPILPVREAGRVLWDIIDTLDISFPLKPKLYRPGKSRYFFKSLQLIAWDVIYEADYWTTLLPPKAGVDLLRSTVFAHQSGRAVGRQYQVIFVPRTIQGQHIDDDSAVQQALQKTVGKNQLYVCFVLLLFMDIHHNSLLTVGDKLRPSSQHLKYSRAV